jgi:hypothetical protein
MKSFLIPHWFGEIVDAEWAESTTHSPVAGLKGFGGDAGEPRRNSRIKAKNSSA